jgi:hypothetical protein
MIATCTAASVRATQSLLPDIWLNAPNGCHHASVVGKKRARNRTGPATSRVEEKLWSRFRSMASFKKSNLTSFS